MTTNGTPFPGPEGAGHNERSRVALSTPPIFLFDGRLCVTDFDTGEPAVVALFEAEADQSSYPALLESILKVGAVALARAGSQVDLGHVAAEVERLSQAVGHSVESFSKVLSAEADAQVKALSSKVEEVLGDDGALVRMLDPADPRGAAAKLTQALTETAEASGRQLVRLLDPSCPEGPMAAFAAELRALSNSVGQLAIQVAATSAAERAAAAEAARGTRKGGVYEDQVVEVLGEIARTSGDVVEAVGARAALDGSKKGDVKVHVSPNLAGAEVSVVFEAKNAKLGLEALKRELAQARSARGAAVAVAVFACEGYMPAGTAPLCEIDPSSFAVVYDPASGDVEALRLAYRFARIVAVAWLREQVRAESVDSDGLRADLSEATSLLKAIVAVKSKIAQARSAVSKNLGDCEESLGSSVTKLSEVISRIEARLRANLQHPAA
jgi:hypothetical protein